jgi:hypothetical protein
LDTSGVQLAESFVFGELLAVRLELDLGEFTDIGPEEELE